MIERHFDTAQNAGVSLKTTPLGWNPQAVISDPQTYTHDSPWFLVRTALYCSPRLESWLSAHSHFFSSNSHLRLLKPGLQFLFFSPPVNTHSSPQQVDLSRASWIFHLHHLPDTIETQVTIFSSLDHSNIFLTVPHASILDGLKLIPLTLAMLIF